jgi:glyoxylase I family protein
LKLLHVSLTAREADTLSSFYRDVFGFLDRRPPKRLTGEIVSRGNGLPNSSIYVVWLGLPDDDGPFLEIMEYDETVSRCDPVVNEPGYGHLAFEVRDLSEAIEDVLRLGGALQGQITNFGTEEKPHLIVYVRDPEGNILELEQFGIR